MCEWQLNFVFKSHIIMLANNYNSYSSPLKFTRSLTTKPYQIFVILNCNELLNNVLLQHIDRAMQKTLITVWLNSYFITGMNIST